MLRVYRFEVSDTKDVAVVSLSRLANRFKELLKVILSQTLFSVGASLPLLLLLVGGCSLRLNRLRRYFFEQRGFGIFLMACLLFRLENVLFVL